MSLIVTLLTGLSLGLGIAMISFACALFYRVFHGESPFNNPLIPMGVSFVLVSVGSSLLFTGLVYSSRLIM